MIQLVSEQKKAAGEKPAASSRGGSAPERTITLCLWLADASVKTLFATQSRLLLQIGHRLSYAAQAHSDIRSSSDAG